MLDKFFKINDLKIYKKIGKSVKIVNGISNNGQIVDEYLVDNNLLEIQFGRVVDHIDMLNKTVYESPLKVTINKNFVVYRVVTSMFLHDNDDETAHIEKIAKEISTKINLSEKLTIKDTTLKNKIIELFNSGISSNPINIEVFYL